MKPLHLTLRPWVPLSLLAAIACGGEDLVLPTDGTPSSTTPARLELYAGDDQAAAMGSPLALPVVVRLVDEAGDGIEGEPVSWTIGAGGGTVVPVSPTTNGQGLASAIWTLGAEGQNTLTAAANGAGSVTFTATGDNSGNGGGGDDDGGSG